MTEADVRTLEVALGERAYPIHIGAGTMRLAGPLLAGQSVRNAVVITNDAVAAHWLPPVRQSLADGRRGRRDRARSRRRSAQELDDVARCAHAPPRTARRARNGRGRAGRWRRRRHRRLCRGDLSARRPVRPDSHDAARAGRLVRRRQDRRQSSAREEHDRRVLSAARRPDRHRLPAHAARSRARRGTRGSDQVRRDPRRRLLRMARRRGWALSSAGIRRHWRKPFIPAAGSRPRSSAPTSASRGSARCSISATRSATRSKTDWATARGCTARPWRPAWSSPPTYRSAWDASMRARRNACARSSPAPGFRWPRPRSDSNDGNR